MAKVKVRKFQGIYTNVDQADLGYEFSKDASNFSFEDGVALVDYPALALNPSVPRLADGYDWERGIQVELTSDNLAEETTSFEKIVTVITAIASNVNGFTRKVFWQVEGGAWDSSDAKDYITETMLTTSVEGVTQFSLEGGRLKIYTPGDAFWLGYIDRDIEWISKVDNINELYFDRLVEPFDFTTPGVEDEELVDGKRLAASATIVQDTNIDDATSGESVAFNFIEDTFVEFESTQIGGEEGQSVTIDAKVYTLQDADENLIAAPVTYGPEFYERLNTGIDEKFLHFFLVSENTRLYGQKKYFDKISNDNVTIQEGQATDFGWPSTWNRSVTELDLTVPGWVYVSAIDDDVQGFKDLESDSIEVIITATVDEITETIVYYEKQTITESNFVVSVKPFFPDEINKRMTRYSIYFRYDKNLDFELYNDIYLLDKGNDRTIHYITELNGTGITLSSRIGIVVDPRDASTYQVVTDIRQRVVTTGYAMAITYSDPVHLKYNIIGGGKIMTDLFYANARTAIEVDNKIIALASVNNKTMIVSETETQVLLVDDVGGSPVFTTIDTLEYGINDWQDIAPVQGGVILHTREGIYLTNGYDKEWFSEPINDQVILNYDTGRIFYNRYIHELYYFPNSTKGEYYTFSFRRRLWSKHDAQLDPVIDIFQLYDGGIAYLATRTTFESVPIRDLVTEGTIFPDTITGSGTALDPYVLYKAEHWDEILTLGTSGVYYKLGNHLDFTGHTFLPIATWSAELDGDGYEISNITYTGAGAQYDGMFRQLNVGGVIKNLFLKDCKFNWTTVGAGTAGRAVLIGYGLGNGNISNIYFNGCEANMDVPSSSFNDKVAIAVGRASSGQYSWIRIENCTATNFKDAGGNRPYAGGFSGDIGSGADLFQVAVRDSTIAARERGAGNWGAVAGIAPVCDSAIMTMTNCYVRDCIMSQGEAVGLLYGFAQRAKETIRCYVANDTPSLVGGSTYNYLSANQTKSAYADTTRNSTLVIGALSRTTTEMQTDSTYNDIPSGTWWDNAPEWIRPSISGYYPELDWPLVKKEVDEGTSEGVDGEVTVRKDDSGFWRPTDEEVAFEAYMESPKGDLNEPDVEKFINFIDVDYSGVGRIIVYDTDDNKIVDTQTSDTVDLNSPERETKRVYINLSNRYSMDRVKYRVESTDSNFILFNIEMDFDVHKRSGEFDVGWTY